MTEGRKNKEVVKKAALSHFSALNVPRNALKIYKKVPRKHLFRGIFALGYKDSNLEMTESESVALPFGDSPIFATDDSIAHPAVKYKFFFKLFSPFFSIPDPPVSHSQSAK